MPSSETQFKPKHGLSSEKGGKRNPTYTSWRTMRQRCMDEKHKSYPDYGGRGISVCDRWNSFECFVADMGMKPDGMTLGRKDNNKGYSPDNCRWESYQSQARNRRSTRFITAFGEKLPFVEMAEKYGIRQDTLSYRLRNGWDVEKALTEPVQVASKSKKVCTGIKRQQVMQLVATGISPLEQA